MAGPSADQVSVDHAGFIDEDAAADFEVELALGNGRHAATLDAAGLGRDLDSVTDTADRFVSAARIKLACRELALTDESLEEIAESLGYPNRYYFSRVFKSKMGCRPAEFRTGGRAFRVDQSSPLRGRKRVSKPVG